MSKVIGYTIRDISIGYSIGYVTCNASNIPLACAFASNIFGLDLRHCLRILLSDFCRSRSGTERDLTISQNGLCGVCGTYDYWSNAGYIDQSDSSSQRNLY